MSVPLIDVIRPYFFTGMDLGSGVQDALGLLHVDEYDTACDDDAIVISGVARIDSTNPSSPFFSPHAGGGAPIGSQGPDEGIVKWEWHDVGIRFRITSPRLAANALPIGDVSDTAVRNLLTALGPTTGTNPSDYPNTQFRLELMFELVSVTFPFLVGARLDGFALVPDPGNREVKISLPKVLLILTQDSGANTDFDVKVGSFGAETLDDADASIASLLQMNPPYALFPGKQFGFGFKKAVLDLSEARTPPDILDQFGVGDDWQGIFLPEVRFFVSTQRSAGVAFNVGARDLLIGLEPDVGIWGDVNIDVDILGDQLKAGLRLYGVSGARIDPELVEAIETDKADRFRVTVPSTSGPDTENYVLFVDINSGAAPFVMTAVSGEEHPADLTEIPDNSFFDDASNSPEDISAPQRIRLFSHDQRVAIRITSRNPAQRRVIVLDVFPDLQTSTSTQPPKRTVPEARLDTGVVVGSSAVRIKRQTDEDVVLELNPGSGALVVDGSEVDTLGGLASFPVAAGTSHDVSATWESTGEEILKRLLVYFQYDFPDEALEPGLTSSVPIRVSDVQSITPQAIDELAGAWRALPQIERRVRVDAYASFEGNSANVDHNVSLAERRADYLISLLPEDMRSSIIERNVWDNRGHPPPVPGIDPRLISGQVPNDISAQQARQQDRNYPAERYRVAVASLLSRTTTTETFSGTLHRDALPPVDTPERAAEPPAPQGQHPNWLRHIGGTVRFEHDIIPVAAELRLTVDFETAHEEGLEEFREDVNEIGPGLEDPEEQNRLPQGDPNPDDGVVEFRLAITHDTSTGAFTETLVARAADSDRDGLWSWGSIPVADATTEPVSDGWRDVLGLYFTLAPLLASSASDTAAGGSIVPLAVELATPVVITTLGIAHVLRFTHYGVELVVRHDEDEIHASLLFDVESALWLNFKIGSFVIVTNRPDKPVKIRYKAVGFAFDAQPDRPISFLPVFDSSRGYTIDLADSGSLKVLPALGDTFGDIIQILGARIARTNPLNIEVELGLGVDLGVVSVDRFGFRVPVDPLGTPTITAIGIGINIPDVLQGRGYLKIEENGFSGQLDITLTSVGLRMAGGLSLQTVTEGDRSATATLVTVAVELPTGIPLGGTGLAVFGFLGLFAMHQRRTENTSARNPALDWLVNVVAGDPTDIRGWQPALDRWAFGVGVVAGTIEGGTILNIKGMMVLELPGPRLVLFVKARILSAKPPTRGTATGNLFAVVDISPQRVLIGIQFDYHLKEVLDLVIPAEAGFFYDPPIFPPEHFYLDVGTISRPAVAKILGLFDATAYFMVHGDGIPDFPLGPLGGLAVAMGFHASFTWGNTAIGLYVRVSAGFDVGIGFTPFLFIGQVFIRGKLRIFIVSVQAHAELDFVSDGADTLISGKICGKVSFWFFSISGCVKFSIGTLPDTPPVPDPIRDLMLQSRSPALIEGSGVDRGLDSVLCHATSNGSVPRIEVREDNDVVFREVFVPIDAIPLIQFEVAPEIAAGATIDGQLSSGLPAGFGGWQKRGKSFLRYTIHSIELRLISRNGVLVASGTSPVTEGPRPYTWRHPAQLPGSDGLPVELALLDWKPTNVDKALIQGPALDSLVDSRWGDICDPVAKPARVLWTFRFEPLGPSQDGWRLNGEPWPDEPGTKRSSAVETEIRVREIWRTGTILDGLLPAIEATVVGAPAQCPRPPRRPMPPTVLLSDLARLSLTPRLPAMSSRFQGSSLFPRGAGRLVGGVVLNAAAPRCISKVLEAPYEVLAETVTLTDISLLEALRELDDQRKRDLRDVIRLSGGPFNDLTLLISARIKMVEKNLVKVRAYAVGGAELEGVSASFTLVSTPAQLPPRWTDTSGPWWDDVTLARHVFSGADKRGWAEYVVRIKLPAAAVQVDIGVSPLADAVNAFGMRPPSYFLAVIDGLTQQEVDREVSDLDESTDDQDGLSDSLGDQKHALLLPNARYEVIVTYDGDIGQKPVKPAVGQDPGKIVPQRTVTGKVARRTFYTDREPPRSLEPWMLAEFPSPGEQYHFYNDPVILLFNTNDVLELFEVYDRQLTAVARAASFRGSVGTPDELLTHLVLATSFRAIEGGILSPWEATVRRHLGPLTCGEFDPGSDRHGQAVLDFKLDPLTDYVLDLEMLTLAGSPAPVPLLPDEVGSRPLYRQGFSTSRYPSRQAFAEQVRTAHVMSRLVTNPAPLLALADRVSDEAFDVALLDSQLGAVNRPNTSSISVLWDTSTPSQPIAILIETPEPLWRTRREPEAQYDQTNNYIISWKLADKLWLLVDELVRADETVLVVDGGTFVRRATGLMSQTAKSIAAFRAEHLGPRAVPPLPLPPPPAARVARFIHDASGTRTLAILNPGSRGRIVSLGLTRNLHPLLDIDTSETPVVLCEVDLTPPPWEELS